jgi:hypothetical protein
MRKVDLFEAIRRDHAVEEPCLLGPGDGDVQVRRIHATASGSQMRFIDRLPRSTSPRLRERDGPRHLTDRLPGAPAALASHEILLSLHCRRQSPGQPGYRPPGGAARPRSGSWSACAGRLRSPAGSVGVAVSCFSRNVVGADAACIGENPESAGGAVAVMESTAATSSVRERTSSLS